MDNTFPENKIDDESKLTKPTRQFALTNETAVKPIKKLMPPPLTSAPLLRPNKMLPLAMQRTIVFRENEKLLLKAAVPPMMLTAEIRVSPDEPAKTLTAPPLAVEPNVVADVDNRA